MVFFCLPQFAIGQQYEEDYHPAATQVLYSLIVPVTATDPDSGFRIVLMPDDSTYGYANSAVMTSDFSFYDTETESLLERYAELTGQDAGDMSNVRLYKFLDDWYGVKYRYGGTTYKGIDCSAFSQKCYNQIFCMDVRRTSRQQYRHSVRIKRYYEANEGDFVFFKVNRVRVSHVGIYLANGYFIHASRSRGVSISNLDNKYWKRRYAGCGHMERPMAHNTESGVAE
jgi:cell wall-associated NlpC family hydrolase